MAHVNADFLRNPEVFCNQFALHPQDAHVTMRKKPEGHFSVAKTERVSYCQIIQGVDFGRGTKVGVNSGAFVAKVSATPPSAGDAHNWFPVFYLPWTAQQTFRTTLRSHQSPLPHGMADPEIFITSAVDGCSVFVEGDPTAPTVYHSNAFDPAGPSAPLGASQSQIDNFFAPKQATMEGWVKATRSPKSVRQNPGAANVTKGIHARDYMDLTMAESARLGRAAMVDVKREAKQNNPKLKKIRQVGTPIYKPCGTVFGWKQNGTWRFFYQKRAIMYFNYSGRKKGLGFGRVTPNDMICREFTLGCYEFWPNGNGHAFARPVVDNRAVYHWMSSWGDLDLYDD